MNISFVDLRRGLAQTASAARRSLFVACGTAALVAGCGGSADAPPPPQAAASTPPPATGNGLSLIAGSIGGSGNLDGSVDGARFNHPTGIAIDAADNLYIADTDNQTIRKITAQGVVSTLAGRPGVAGGDDGPAAQATFNSPTGVAVDASGIIYVADWGGSTVRQITADGTVSTLAGSYQQMGYVNDTGTAARFSHPYALAIDQTSGTLFITDQVYPHALPGDYSSSIRTLSPSGDVGTFDTFEDIGTIPFGVVANPLYSYDVYFSILQLTQTELGYMPGASQVLEDYGDGFDLIAGDVLGSSDGIGSDARFDYASGLAIVASGGSLYAGDACNGTLRQISIDTSGVDPAPPYTSTLAGTARPPVANPSAGFICNSTANSADGTGPAAEFDNPAGTAVDSAGNVYVVDNTASVIRRVTPQGVVTTFAGVAFQVGSTDGAGVSARFAFNTPPLTAPQGATAIDDAGDIFVADAQNLEIRKISSDGTVSTLAGSPGVSGSTDGHGAAASFGHPIGIASDSAGNVFVADDNTDVIRKITPAGDVSTFAGTAGVAGSTDGSGSAASFDAPRDVAIDAQGNLYVADTGNHAIRKITPAGMVSTLAGSAATGGGNDGTGAAAGFTDPVGLAVDSASNLYVADSGNDTIRKVSPDGVVTTLAGTAGQAGSADGAGSAAGFNAPSSVSVDDAGNVYVADTGNDTVRKITPAGVVTTLIGVVGSRGVHLGSDARLDTPSGLSIQGHDLLLISAGAVLRYALP